MNKQNNLSVETIDLTNEPNHTKHNSTITIDDSFAPCSSDSPSELEQIIEDDELFTEYPPEPSPLPCVSVESDYIPEHESSISKPAESGRQRALTPIFFSSSSDSSSSPSPNQSSTSTSVGKHDSSKSFNSSRSFDSSCNETKTQPKATKAAIREQKKKEREEKRQHKKRQKEEEKLLQEANRANAAVRALDNCEAKIHSQILDLINDKEEIVLKTIFDESTLKYQVIQSPKLDKSISWTYRRVEVEDGKCKETFWDSDWTLVVMDGEDYLRRLVAYRNGIQKSNSLKDFIIECRNAVKTELVFVVYNLSGFIKSERAKEAKNHKRSFKNRFEGTNSRESSEIINDAQLVTNIDLQELRIKLELEIKHELPDVRLHFEFIEKTIDAVQLFAGYSKSVAKLEIKRRTRSTTGIDWAINVDKERAVDPCKSTEDLTRLWIAQLQQFAGLTLPIAKAIAAEYPSPCALLDQYASLTQSEGENLLAELYIQRNLKRQIGQSISKRIHRFMTSEDPDVHIGLDQ